MRVLLTGASGFVGSRLVATGASRHDLIAVSRFQQHRTADCEWVQVDLSDRNVAERLPRTIDAVIHLAQADAGSAGSAEDLAAVNAEGTARLVRYAIASGARAFLHASTATVYARSNVPLDEEAPVDLRSDYAASKRAGELAVSQAAPTLCCTALRIFTVYGPGQTQRLIPELISRVREGRPVSLDGERGLAFSPIYVDDLVGILLRVLEAPASPGFDVVNVAADERLDIRAAAEAIGRLLHREPLFERRSRDDPGGFIADTSRLRMKYGVDMTSFTGFERGLELTLQTT